MNFYDSKFFYALPKEKGQIQGHWLLAYRGAKDAVGEVYAYTLTAKENFYGCDYPGFVRDFEKTKEFLIKKDGQWRPCEWENCRRGDEVLLRAHSLSPCGIEALEDRNLFFNLWDDMPVSAELAAAYGLWPLDPTLNGYFCYLDPVSDGWREERIDYSAVLGWKRDQFPPEILDMAKFTHDEWEGTFAEGDFALNFDIQEMLGVKFDG